ncbi:hypothetical protein [uncultured Aquitalea sp.]|uniref:hypothetical protein n=1 Tax=uncultured Aquitalea sp. TaxID=540272 RepID=UPI0025F9C2D7|nr:hypothetical protein [uncultured Aquitalea sp.]
MRNLLLLLLALSLPADAAPPALLSAPVATATKSTNRAVGPLRFPRRVWRRIAGKFQS